MRKTSIKGLVAAIAMCLAATAVFAAPAAPQTLDSLGSVENLVIPPLPAEFLTTVPIGAPLAPADQPPVAIPGELLSPFPAGRTWTVYADEHYPGNVPHPSFASMPFDLGDPTNNAPEVLAVGAGYAAKTCITDNMAVVLLSVVGHGVFIYVHLDADRLPSWIKENQWTAVGRGQSLGYLWPAPFGVTTIETAADGCQQFTSGAHLHFEIPYDGVVIDGQSFGVIAPNAGATLTSTNVEKYRPTCQGLFPNIIGFPGDDLIVATSGADVIAALGGDDYILGMGGDDKICAGNGDDRAYGGEGDDVILLGDGKDRARGQNGNDRIDGGDGNDNLNGNNGDDVVNGQDGHDYVAGKDGVDVVTGGPGTDTVNGGGKSDTVKGGSGNDTINGNGFGDTLEGGTGNDDLIGGSGNDQIFGGAGNDVLDGGGDNDNLNGGSGSDICNGRSGSDTAQQCETTIGVP